MQTFRYVRKGNKSEYLIDFVARRFPYLSEEQWGKNIDAGNLLLNSEKAFPQMILRTGDCIAYLRKREDEPPVNTDVKILSEDKHLLAVDKNSNIPVSESGRYHLNTLINVLKEKFSYLELYPLHRLDRETSGVTLIAKTKEAAAILGEDFAKGIPEKKYAALLLGEMEQSNLIVDLPILKNKNSSKVRIRQIVDPAGKKAKTKFSLLRKRNGLSFVEIRLFTGRTHQIRCHAEYIGYPVLGDKLYGRSDDDFLDFVTSGKLPDYGKYGTVERHMLHAAELSVLHPVSRKRITFISDAENTFSEILRQNF